MPRAPIQSIVLPFRTKNETPEYAIFQRTVESGGFWQFISGGAEDDETPTEAARREMSEEAGLKGNLPLYRLESMTTIPVVNVRGRLEWGENHLNLPEYSFGVRLDLETIQISHEHTAFRWSSFEEAWNLLKWDSNKNALWELNYRLLHSLLPPREA